MIDHIDPYEDAQMPEHPDRAMRAFIAPIFGAMAMDTHPLLVEAWDAILSATPRIRDDHGLVTSSMVADPQLKLMLEAFDAMPEVPGSRWDDDQPRHGGRARHGQRLAGSVVPGTTGISGRRMPNRFVSWGSDSGSSSPSSTNVSSTLPRTRSLPMGDFNPRTDPEAEHFRTAIIATLGPASWDEPVLERLIKAGANIFRLNFSHGDEAGHERTLTRIRTVASRLGVPIGVLGDLPGPKIRLTEVPGDGILLEPGQRVEFHHGLASALHGEDGAVRLGMHVGEHHR